MQPQILLLDEPTSYLDPQATHDILAIIRDLNQKLGITVIVAGHQVNEIAPLCDRVWLMNDGELISDLPIDQAFTDLKPYTRLGVQVPRTRRSRRTIRLFGTSADPRPRYPAFFNPNSGFNGTSIRSE